MAPNANRNIVAYACEKDAHLNISRCQEPTNFSFTSSSAAGVLTSPFSLTGATSLTFNPILPGTSSITASRTVNGATMTTTSDPLTVAPSVLTDFSVKDNTLTVTPTVAAGFEQTVSLCKIDNANNIVTSPASSTLSVTINNSSPITNAEGKSVEMSTGTGAAFAASTFGFGVKTLTFINGCVDIYAKVLASGVYNDAPLLSVSYTDVSQAGNPMIFGSGLTVGTVTVQALDHYSTTVDSSSLAALNVAQAWNAVGATNTAASSAGNRFGVTVYARDVNGNTVTAPSSTTVTLSLATYVSPTLTDMGAYLKCSAPANDLACLSVNMSGLSSATVANLASQIGGTLYIKATDGTYGFNATQSTAATVTTSRKTIASYSISTSSSMVAGSSYGFLVYAKDASGATVLGADADLSTLVFTLSDASSALISTHIAPDGSAPIISSLSVFTVGVVVFG